jgi:2-succinyl-5-enolpyruvyl-6-hydroxy-3-cyclohexene-1-carboxylate synthase
MASPKNLQTEWARLVVVTLADAGVTDAVVSPGSRSTPYVLALAREPRMRVVSVVDERVAAFLALGTARMTGRPGLLLCTSGTALAHYLPAVIEASESGLPLIVLSADRPPEVYDAAANQTIRQANVYGAFTRWSADLGVPESALPVLRGLRRRVLQAVRAALADKPGPVHLNAPARKPLEPPADLGPDDAALAATVDTVLRTRVEPVGRPARHAAEDTIAAWAAAIAGARGCGIVVCGPGAGTDAAVREAVVVLACEAGFPVLAEAASGLRFCGPLDAGVRRVASVDALLRAGLGSDVGRPAVIVQVGRPLVATGWERVAALPDVRHVVAPFDWPDPDGTAVSVVQAEPGAFLNAVRVRLGATPRERDLAYSGIWSELDAAAGRAADAIVAADGDRLSEGAAVRTLVAHLPDDAILAVGNSLPVRHLDAWAPPTTRRLRVLVQRGASGIDGLVAGIAGAHRAAGRPAALLVGDVSFMHDLGALAVVPGDGPPLLIVVLDNEGGRIFEQLPVAARAADVLPLFVTPPRVDLALAATAFGVPHLVADGVAAFTAAVVAALARAGTTVIQARVPPHGAAAAGARLAADVAALVRRAFA